MLILLLGVECTPALAQEGESQVQMPDTTENALVHRVRFEGNEHFSSGELSRQIQTNRNRRFLGVPGLTWWLWLYRLGDSGALGERISDALIASGESPALVSRSRIQSDVDRLESFYRREGFRESRVDARVEPVGDERAEVIFRIAAGRPLYSRFVRYDGLEMLDSARREELVRGSLLNPVATDTVDYLSFRAGGERYSEARMVEERQRILQLLRDDGYATVTRDSVRAFIYPQQPDSFDVTFQVRPGARFRMGNVYFDVQGVESEASVRRDTLLHKSPGAVISQIYNERRLSTRLLERSLNHEPGDWYDQSALLEMKRRLDATGVFAFSDIAAMEADTVNVADSIQVQLPHQVTLQTRPRHLIRFETFMLQRTGLLSAENEIGTGVGTTYENLNLFGAGESFRLRTTGSIAADFDFSFFPSAQAEMQASLTAPYLIQPFSGLDDALNLFNARTQFSLTFLTARRENLRFILRGRGNARLRLNMQHTATLSSLFDVLDVSLSNPDTLSGFNVFLDGIIGPEDDPVLTDPVQRAQIQEDYTQPQINSVMRYTFRSARFNPLRRDEGYSYEAAVEIGNVVPYLLDRHVIKPDQVEYALPGLPFLGGDTELIYRPYIRGVADLRRYLPLGGDDVLASKFMAGIAHPIAGPTIIPFERRFYSGGASSVRGWGLRELRPRPGTRRTDESPNILGGDIKLEASVEARTSVLRQVLGASWSLAGFVDAGNVWYGPRNPGSHEERFRLNRLHQELGVGSGIGIRVDWDYLILRLDIAHRVHDPLRPGTGILPDGLSNPRLHFGIGQAF